MNLIKLLFLGVILIGSGVNYSLAAEVYRQVDEEGNVIFTDQPAKGAEKVEVKPPNVHNFPQPPEIKPLPRQTPKQPLYKAIEITSPANDATIRNPGDVLIRAAVSPNLRRYHKVRFTDNGQPLEAPSRSLSLQLYNLSRGTHIIKVEVLDANDKLVIASEPVAIHVHRTSIIKPQQPPPTKTNP